MEHGLLVTLEQVRRNWVRSPGLSLGCLIKEVITVTAANAPVNSRIEGEREKGAQHGCLSPAVLPLTFQALSVL